MTIEEFVKKDNYVDSYKKVCDWQEFSVYEIWAKSDEGACTGYPQFALDKNGIIRKSNLSETIAIMDAENK
jgi:hypothetical protein